MMLLAVFKSLCLLLWKKATVEVVCDDVAGEGNHGDAEAGEHVGEHLPPGEDGMSAPSVTFRPRVAVEVWPSHCLDRNKRRSDESNAGRGEVYGPV